MKLAQHKLLNIFKCMQTTLTTTTAIAMEDETRARRVVTSDHVNFAIELLQEYTNVRIFPINTLAMRN